LRLPALEDVYAARVEQVGGDREIETASLLPTDERLSHEMDRFTGSSHKAADELNARGRLQILAAWEQD
jgi:hypothetical protein